MPVSEKEIIEALVARFTDINPDSDILLRDTVGDRDHYELHIKSHEFLGRTPIQRHRMVMGALDNLLKNKLHAISITTEVKK